MFLIQFGVYEWVMTEDWDPSIPRHKELAHQIELGNGIPEMRHISSARNALKNVGFDIEHEEDLADSSDEIPWYYPLEGDMRKAQTFWDYLTVWRTSKMGQFFTHNGTWFMEKVGLIPKGTWSVGESLRLAGDALVAGGQSKVRRSLTPLPPSTLTYHCNLPPAVYANVPCRQPQAKNDLASIPVFFFFGSPANDT
jgi:sterol 24-C-methyltransferase